MGSEDLENSMVLYLKYETNSYYFSLAICYSIIKEYPNNYASAIRHNIIILCCGEWQKPNPNYYFKYYSCEAGLSYYYILLQRKNIEMD